MSTENSAYLLIFRYPDKEPDPTPEEMQRIFEKWRVWIQGMRAAGRYLAGDPLEEEPAQVLRGPHGAKVIDGPFAEAQEIVAGYVMVRAASFAEATEIAKGCPALDLPSRSVEVRQVKPMPM
jgi:hypothetical protein